MRVCLLFPVSSEQEVGFCSPVLLLNILSVVLQVPEVVLLSLMLCVTEYKVMIGLNLVFMVLSIFLRTKLILLARRWPVLMRRWSDEDAIFNTSDYEIPRLGYFRYTKHLLAWHMLWLISGYSISMFWRYTTHHANIEACHLPKNYSWLASMYDRERSYISAYIPFKPWVLVILEIQEFIRATSWMLIFVFIIALSVWLKARFDQLLKKIQKAQDLGTKEGWTEICLHFQRLVDLTAKVDKEVGFLILLTCFCMTVSLCFAIFMFFRLVEFL